MEGSHQPRNAKHPDGYQKLGEKHEMESLSDRPEAANPAYILIPDVWPLELRE